MNTESNRTTETPEDVLNELRALVSEAERIVAQSPKGSCDCDTTLAGLRERFEAAQERLTATYRETKRKVIDGTRYADETIRTHPYESLAIALGIGVLAGVLIGRRSNSGPQ